MIGTCASVIHERQQHYDVVSAEVPMTVQRGSIVAIPLYDGTIITSKRDGATLLFMGAIVAPTKCSIRWPNVGGRTHESNRFALFKIMGRANTGATLWVKMPRQQDNCYDCRLVHFMIRVIDRP